MKLGASFRRWIHGENIKRLIPGVSTHYQTLDVREAYRLWAPTYAAETTTSFLNEQLAQDMLCDLPQKRLLDAGCGIGRRIRDIPNALGIDQSADMLAAGGATNVIIGDIREMPSNQTISTWYGPG